jgi:hypothetical protein
VKGGTVRSAAGYNDRLFGTNQSSNMIVAVRGESGVMPVRFGPAALLQFHTPV